MKILKSPPFFVIAFITIVSLACGASTPAPTATPLPTSTPAPTATPLPTNTPVPQIPGVDIPMKYSGIGFTVTSVELAGSWDIDGPKYPTTPGDVFLALTFKVDGNLFTLPIPAETKDSERTFHITDNFGRVDQWATYSAAEDGSTFTLVFVVDGSARDYIYSWPNGQEVDLAPFLD